MKKTILIASGLAVLFLIVMWLVFPFLNGTLLNAMQQSSKSVGFSASTIGGEFALRLKTAFSFALLPLISLGVFLLVRNLKNPEYANRKLTRNLGFFMIAYIIGFYVKCRMLLGNLEYTEAHPIARGVTFEASVDSLYYYDYAVVCSLVTGLVLFLLAKRIRDNDELLDQTKGF